MPVKERPILFSGPMVRALLDGRKTQTRRVVKPQPPEGARYSGIHYASYEPSSHFFNSPSGPAKRRCPYGEEGDQLWVRETFAFISDCRHDDPGAAALAANAFYRADEMVDCGDITRWRPSIHMPRWASRLTLEITDVRVERLLDCSDADAQAEGLMWVTPGMWSVDRTLPIIGHDARRVYFELWDHINGSGTAAANPWVWAVSFRMLERA